MKYFPVFLDIMGKKVLVVGGGKVAQRKIEMLLSFGSDICIVSKELTALLQRKVEDGTIRLLGEEFHEDDLAGMSLVIAATDDQALNRRVSLKARERGLMVNAVDQPSDCDFIVPSMVRRGDLLIAISTSGKSPALAKRIRQRLERTFG